MTKRYYKAQIGDRTYFRATGRIYASALVGRYGLTFSSKPAAPGWSPTVEITKAEYDRLQEAKALRQGGALYNSPQESWVEGFLTADERADFRRVEGEIP